eukprot:COSAG02_NODE_1397_length_12873_cov_18.498043_2_plen_628_part_00
MNLVCLAQGSDTTIKLIDFDASAKYGELCHLKFSSAFAPPQLAAELLAYESSTGHKPTEASAPMLWAEWVRSRGSLKASVAKDIWAFGILAFKMCVEDGASMFLSSEADNIVHLADLEKLAYFWDLHKLEEVNRVVWNDAADFILKCLQTDETRRPRSFGELLDHPFFDENYDQVQVDHQSDDTDQPRNHKDPSAFGEEQAVATQNCYFPQRVAIRAQMFHSAIEAGNVVAVTEQLQAGGVHVMLVDESRTSNGVRATPLMRAALTGDTDIVQELLGEIEDSWPDKVRKKYLDHRTSHGFTAYMIACARGHEEMSKLFEAKGCSVDLINDFGKTGAVLLQANQDGRESSTCESLESYLASLSRKSIVMSCPEMGTLDQDGGAARLAEGVSLKAVYNQHVMIKVSELQKLGYVKLGFDRAGTSTARERDKDLFDEAFKLRDDGKHQEAIALLKATDWWYGYETSVKQAVKLESQGFDGELVIICIKGGFITSLEAAEMERIMTEATEDCLKSEIAVKCRIEKVSYLEFVAEYDVGSLASETQSTSSSWSTSATADLVKVMDTRDHDVHTQLAKARAQLLAKDGQIVAKDEELAAKDEELVAKDEQLAAKDEELQQMREQLARLEGVPP